MASNTEIVVQEALSNTVVDNLAKQKKKDEFVGAFQGSTKNSMTFTKDRLKEKIDQVKEASNQTQRRPNDYIVLRKYDLKVMK